MPQSHIPHHWRPQRRRWRTPPAGDEDPAQGGGDRQAARRWDAPRWRGALGGVGDREAQDGVRCGVYLIGKECRHIEFFSKNLMETGGMPKTNARTPTTEVLPLRTRGRSYGRRNLRTTWRGWRRGAMQDIPRDPHIKYRDDGWISMLDWLGYTGRGPHDSMREMLPFADARAIVRSAKEWWAWCKSGQRPYNISHSTHIRFHTPTGSATRVYERDGVRCVPSQWRGRSCASWSIDHRRSGRHGAGQRPTTLQHPSGAGLHIPRRWLDLNA